MDPDSKSSLLVRLAPLSVGLIAILCATVLTWFGQLTESAWVNIVSVIISLAFGARMMTLPSATTSTTEKDPTTGKVVKETKTQQPLGMPAPSPVGPPLPGDPSTPVTVVNKDPVPVDVVDPAKGPTP